LESISNRNSIFDLKNFTQPLLGARFAVHFIITGSAITTAEAANNDQLTPISPIANKANMERVCAPLGEKEKL